MPLMFGFFSLQFPSGLSIMHFWSLVFVYILSLIHI